MKPMTQYVVTLTVSVEAYTPRGAINYALQGVGQGRMTVEVYDMNKGRTVPA